MGRSQRDKGRKGEREVALIYEGAGFEIRGLEGSGDHLAIGYGLTIHSESKRQEVTRPWLWDAQANAEAPPGALPVVAFRRNLSPWIAQVRLEPLVGSLGLAYRAGIEVGRR